MREGIFHSFKVKKSLKLDVPECESIFLEIEISKNQKKVDKVIFQKGRFVAA